MFLEDIPVHYLAVVIAAAVYFFLGAVWYSPQVFGKILIKHDPAHPEAKQPHMILSLIGEAFIGLIMSYILALFIEISNADMVIKGVVVSLWIWLGFIATSYFSAVLWGKKSLINFFVHAGFLLTALLLMGAVISGLK